MDIFVFYIQKKDRGLTQTAVFQWVFREKPRFQSVIEVRPPYQSGFVHPWEDVAPGFDVHVPLGAPPWCRTGGSFRRLWRKMQKREVVSYRKTLDASRLCNKLQFFTTLGFVSFRTTFRKDRGNFEASKKNSHRFSAKPTTQS